MASPSTPLPRAWSWRRHRASRIYVISSIRLVCINPLSPVPNAAAVGGAGHVNFSDEVTAGLRLADGAILVVDVAEGVGMQTQRLLVHAIQQQVHSTTSCVSPHAWR